MSSTPGKRTRSERVASIQGRPNALRSLWRSAGQQARWPLVVIPLVAAIVILVICRCWYPPFSYRPGQIPGRDLVARTTFQVHDRAETELLQRQKRREVLVYYENRTLPLTQRREALRDRLFRIGAATSLDQMDADTQKAWAEFFEGDETAVPGQGALASFAAIRALYAEDPKLNNIDQAVQAVLQPLYSKGLLRSLGHQIDEGNQLFIRVYPEGKPEESAPVEVDQVRIAQVLPDFKNRLRAEFQARFAGEWPELAAELIGDWLAEKMPETLFYDRERSEAARREAAGSVGKVMTTYYAGVSKLAMSGRPLILDEEAGQQPSLVLLRAEWEAMLAEMSWLDRIFRTLAYAGMIAAIYLLAGVYIYFLNDRNLLTDPLDLTRLCALVTITIVACKLMGNWQMEIVPLTVAAMTATVVYGRPLALLLLAIICLAVTLLTGQELAALVGFLAASFSCILLLGPIRTRHRLVYVGLGAAGITAATVLGVGFITGQVAGIAQSDMPSSPTEVSGLWALVTGLSLQALWTGVVGCGVGGILMAGLLPFVERAFQVQTDLSLLELGDASHPLLRQLSQRAPGTYNHSINVASIAEAAADAIGGNGLLVRVGAYFHDIGKIFKPEYFIENQGQGPNQHTRLQPAMSTLVIIAHVKDGADLARSHKLPEPIVDFIVEHHGTTLVEYFYREATRRSEEDPNGEEVFDKDFRYPGPKPQTLEAAVLMMADSVESASRALVDPTPSRIQSLVDGLAMKKLIDGQFDECGLTLTQLNQVKKSLVKSLTAIYHSRVKYPGQQSA